jgi:hypothetical protein
MIHSIDDGSSDAKTWKMDHQGETMQTLPRNACDAAIGASPVEAMVSAGLTRSIDALMT